MDPDRFGIGRCPAAPQRFDLKGSFRDRDWNHRFGPDFGADEEAGLPGVAGHGPGQMRYGPSRPATIVYRGKQEPKAVPVSLDRLRQLLKGCKSDWESRIVLEFYEVTHRGTNITWKCDARSTAWADMTSAIGVKDGAVDFIGISPMLDYPVPLAG